MEWEAGESKLQLVGMSSKVHLVPLGRVLGDLRHWREAQDVHGRHRRGRHKDRVLQQGTMPHQVEGLQSLGGMGAVYKDL